MDSFCKNTIYVTIAIVMIIVLVSEYIYWLDRRNEEHNDARKASGLNPTYFSPSAIPL
jgi:hypothetical protein